MFTSPTLAKTLINQVFINAWQGCQIAELGNVSLWLQWGQYGGGITLWFNWAGLWLQNVRLPAPSGELAHEIGAKAWISWALKWRALRQAGFTEQREPSSLDSGGTTTYFYFWSMKYGFCLIFIQFWNYNLQTDYIIHKWMERAAYMIVTWYIRFSSLITWQWKI